MTTTDPEESREPVEPERVEPESEPARDTGADKSDDAATTEESATPVEVDAPVIVEAPVTVESPSEGTGSTESD